MLPYVVPFEALLLPFVVPFEALLLPFVVSFEALLLPDALNLENPLAASMSVFWVDIRRSATVNLGTEFSQGRRLSSSWVWRRGGRG